MAGEPKLVEVLAIEKIPGRAKPCRHCGEKYARDYRGPGDERDPLIICPHCHTPADAPTGENSCAK